MEKRSTSKSPRSSSGSDGGDGSDGNDRSCSRSRSPRGSPPFHIDGVGGVCDSSCGRATNKPGSPRSVVQSPNSTFSPASFCLVSPDCSPPRSCALAYEDETEKEAGVEEAKDEVEEDDQPSCATARSRTPTPPREVYWDHGTLRLWTTPVRFSPCVLCAKCAIHSPN
eukprot:TRINITY_DN9536_c0_g1_i4.p1 TRINITY_DN9536_c0_g1~~TRINITY_DN9536_c0_g1_i4.p1  ORF type:complete len:168 (+),score=24.21 TRINITY_DN9536_c0_g1_i4:110-613(+)